MASRTSATGGRRLSIIAVLIGSLVLTLFGRLYYVQLLDPHRPTQAADVRHLGTIVIPAPRGDIVDSRGRPLVENTAHQVITVDRQALQQQSDQGAGVLARLGSVLHIDPGLLAKQITPCSPTVPAPCWTGEPYQPVPVAADASTAAVLAVSEHRELYPGIALQTVTLPSYPNGSLAAHVLGYTGQVTDADLKANPKLVSADSIGLSGLEQQYDSVLRGVDGQQYVQLDPRGIAVGTDQYVPAQQGDTLVTSIDANVQKLAEQAITAQIAASRKAGKPATSASVVVMDPNSGRIIALASWPTYNPQLFSGGISNADYAQLVAPSANDPLLNRATDGQYAPGSTFKLITSSSLVMHHEISLDQTYPCPGEVTIDGRVKTNFESESKPYPITLSTALGYSCDTFFYAPAAQEYYADQARIAANAKPLEYLQHMAASFGIGTRPGIDLPADEQATGGYADRETRLADWQANKATWCAEARTGYPGVSDPTQRAYLTKLASENCTDGWRYRAGDNADMSIGEGDTLVSPLQLATAYSALVNGGKLWEPTIGWGVVNGSGQVVKTINPTLRGKVPVSQSLLNYIADSLAFRRGWQVSGAFVYIGTPIQNMLGGKTGTAEVYGKQDTSWLASWGPLSSVHGAVNARFVAIGMVEQGGTGATSAGPMLQRVWNGLLGSGQPAVLPNSRPATKMPTIAAQVRVSGAAPTGPSPSGGQSFVAPPAVPTYPPRPR